MIEIEAEPKAEAKPGLAGLALPKFKRISEVVWEISKDYKTGMLVPARVYATEKLLKEMEPVVFDQTTNVACLPGIVKYAICLPDGHSGYGFPIGGVAAFDYENGIISPGGIGFDINCGMRLVTTNLTFKELQPKLKELVDLLFKRVPAGVGARGFLRPTPAQFAEVMQAGAKWCIEQGYGWEEDLERIEEYGCISGANPDKVSERAVQRGLQQLGTLGSGNHYLEIQVAEAKNIFLPEIAKKLGIYKPDQICVMVHCGSRGFGHQIATDYLKIFLSAMPKYEITVRDKQLACAPFQSVEGQNYYAAMACAANSAFANRQVILHRIRECFSQVFNRSPEDLELHLVYDVAHNIAKVEKHVVDGEKRLLVVHRKGATRCFGPSSQELAPMFREIGQPVIIGGSMETGSYLLIGTEKSMEETFGSTAHGSGRTMSRTKAKRIWRGEQLQKEMLAQGIYVRSVSFSGLAEEAGGAYKNISEVAETMEIAGISKKVVAFRPVGNVKG